MFQHIKYVLSNPGRWKRWVIDGILDLKFGKKFLGGMIQNSKPLLGREASTSSDYEALTFLFSQIEIKSTDVIIDIGCGKGRVFNWALHAGLKNKLIGIEVDPEMAEFTRGRLKTYPQVDIMTADICEPGVIPSQGTIFYIFNPFSEAIVKKFADLIIKLDQNFLNKTDRPLIIYYNCSYLHVFENNPLWKIKKFGIISSMNLPAAIITPNKD